MWEVFLNLFMHYLASFKINKPPIDIQISQATFGKVIMICYNATRNIRSIYEPSSWPVYITDYVTGDQ